MHLVILGLHGVNVISLNTTKKSTHGELDKDRAIFAACEATRGIRVLIPVYFAGSIIGYTYTPPNSWTTHYIPMDGYHCTFTNYADLKSEINKQKRYNVTWAKSFNAATANYWYDTWFSPLFGMIAPDTEGSTRTAVVYDDYSNGTLRHGDDVSTDTKHIINSSTTGSIGAKTIILYDRELDYSNCEIASTNKTMTNVQTASRHVGGSNPGLQIMCTVQSTTGATPASFSQLQYTDQAGNATQDIPVASEIKESVTYSSTSGAMIISPVTFVDPSYISLGPFMPLAAGDSGVQLIDNYTCSSDNTGTMCLALVYPLLVIPMETVALAQSIDQVLQTSFMSKIVDRTCLSMIVYTAGTGTRTYGGNITVAWG